MRTIRVVLVIQLRVVLVEPFFTLCKAGSELTVLKRKCADYMIEVSLDSWSDDQYCY